MGAVLYEMLAGRPPHVHAHVPALLVEIATVAPRPVELLRTEVSPSLAGIVGRALAKDRDARIPTADALVTALRGELGLPSEAPRARSGLEADTIDPAPLRASPTAETALEIRRRDVTPSAPTRSGTRETSRGNGTLVIVVSLLVVALTAAAAWAWRGDDPPPSDTRAITAPVLAPTLAEPRVEEMPPPPATHVPEVVTSTPRPRPLGHRAPPSVAPPTEVPATELAPPPTTTVDPPASSTPVPRAGRLGLDDL
jgi:serine/threonine-protein kinase